MDTIIPFAETFETSGLKEAVEVAGKAAQGTKDLKASFGRASYVGVGDGEEGVPDPGAWAFWEVVRGIGEVVG